MHTKYEIYPLVCIYRGEKSILLWKTCDVDEQDRFEINRNNKLLSAKSVAKLKNKLGSRSIKVHWAEISEIDFDKFWQALNNMRIGKASSAKTCCVLLDGWNIIEDLLRTFELANELRQLKSEKMKYIYEKIYHGVNIPAVTPEGKSYSPLWTKEELYMFRNSIKISWKICCRFINPNNNSDGSDKGVKSA